MLAQIATALLAFASHHKLEDAKEAPTKSVYATAGTSGAGADPRKRCSEGQHEGMNMDKAACRAACIGTSGCTHAIHFSDNGCQISTKGCTLVSHSYGADTDEVFEPPLCAKGTDCTDCVYKTPGGVAKSLYDASNSDQKLLAHFQSVLSFLYDTKDCKFPHFLDCEEIQNWEEHIGKILNANFNLKNPLTLQRSPAPPPPSPPSAPRIELPECAQPTWKSVPAAKLRAEFCAPNFCAPNCGGARLDVILPQELFDLGLRRAADTGLRTDPLAPLALDAVALV